METDKFIPLELHKKLQNTYKQLPARQASYETEETSNSALKEFLELYGSQIKFQAGEILFRQNDPADGLYWIEDGVLTILQGNLQDLRLVAFRHPGQVIGEMALLEDIQRTATVVALNDTLVNYISRTQFQELLSLIPGFGVELMRILSARLREIKPAEYDDGLYDSLTGALSRQAFEARLQNEIERAELYEYALALVFVDLDNFKEINDRYGHTRGDQALTHMVKQFRSKMRVTDLIFRYGGDEFVLLLQGADETNSPALLGRILKELQTTPIPGEPPAYLGFSAGIAYFPRDGDNLQDLLEAADQRVYQAKRSGRGNIIDH